jgi:phosphoglycerate dehydrogenase-like enzyme
MINAGVFNAMKPSAYLVNAARGPIVDEAALVSALQARRIAGAAVDVYDPEPPSRENPLYQLDNIVLSPHLASMTEEGRRRMGVTVVEEVLKVLRGEMPAYIANPEVHLNEGGN